MFKADNSKKMLDLYLVKAKEECLITWTTYIYQHNSFELRKRLFIGQKKVNMG